jgi:sulfur-carrier protein
LRVELRLYASLQKYLPGEPRDGVVRVEVEEGTTLWGLLERLHIPPEAPRILFLNGVHARGDEALKEGDRVGAFPPVAGG